MLIYKENPFPEASTIMQRKIQTVADAGKGTGTMTLSVKIIDLRQP
jgi:hypothetical protein